MPTRENHQSSALHRHGRESLSENHTFSETTLSEKDILPAVFAADRRSAPIFHQLFYPERSGRRRNRKLMPAGRFAVTANSLRRYPRQSPHLSPCGRTELQAKAQDTWIYWEFRHLFPCGELRRFPYRGCRYAAGGKKRRKILWLCLRPAFPNGKLRRLPEIPIILTQPYNTNPDTAANAPAYSPAPTTQPGAKPESAVPRQILRNSGYAQFLPKRTKDNPASHNPAVASGGYTFPKPDSLQARPYSETP